ncbi:hypothetical protein Droror1_Dr00027584 [Drosera rotundifolia]
MHKQNRSKLASNPESPHTRPNTKSASNQESERKQRGREIVPVVGEIGEERRGERKLTERRRWLGPRGRGRVAAWSSKKRESWGEWGHRGRARESGVVEGEGNWNQSWAGGFGLRLVEWAGQGEGNGYTVAAQRISSTSNKIAVADSNAERDGKLTCSFDLSRSFKDMFHPCRYFELAGRAFLECLGLISFPWNPSPDDTEEDANN